MKYLIALTILLVAGFAVRNGLHASEPLVETSAVKTKSAPGELHFSADAPQLSFIHIGAVSEAPIPALEPLQGHVTYDEDITSRISTPVAGRIVKIAAQIGDAIKVGQPLLIIDAPEFGQANADKRKADSDLRLKQAAMNRAQILFDGGVIATKDFESARADFEQAQAEAERAQARLNNLGLTTNARGEGFILRAGINGVVTERQVNPGSEVRPDNGNTLFVISDPKTLWINIDVAERDLNKIHRDQHLQIQVDAYPDEKFDAVVSSIGKVLDPSTRRIAVRCVVHDPGEHLKPEMYVRATPLEGSQTRPYVPNNALVIEGVKAFLFVEKAPGVLEKRAVALAYRGRENSFVQEGLQVGERIAVNGALLLNAELLGG